MNIIKTAVQRPVGVIMLVVCLLLVGFVTLRDIPIDLYPEMETPTVTVSAFYDNVAPQDMEKMVTEPIEAQIASLNGVENIFSTTSTGSARIRVTFDNSVDFDKAVMELQEQMSQVTRLLPDGVDTPTISQFDMNSTPIMTLALVGKDTVSLEKIANDISPEFERIAGVAGVSVEGGRSAELQITLNPILLNQYNLSANDVANAIRNKNTSGTVGSVPRGDEELQIRVDGEYTSLDQIGQTPIRLDGGHTITINDIAEITDSESEVDSITRINRETGVLLSISKQSGSNTVSITNSIYQVIERKQAELEEGLSLIVVDDQSTFIRVAIEGVVQSLIIGGVFAVFVLLFFLRSVRATLVIGLSIPIAIVATFILLRYSGQTLNVITLSGLALGIGMMVDSSIVILENIIKYKQQGAQAKEAAIQGGSELVSAVIASTTTTVVVFLPMILINSGQITDLFLPLAYVVSFSLLASLLVGITLVPMISSKMLETGKNVKWLNDPAWLRFLLNMYERMLKISLKFRWLVALGVILLTIGSCFFFSSLDVDTFPRSEEQRINLSAQFDAGTDFTQIEAYANQAEEILEKYADSIQLQQTSINAMRINFSLQLVDPSERELTTAELSSAIEADLKENIVGVNFTAGRVFRMAGGGGSALQINIAGPDQEVLTTLLEQLDLLLSRIPVIENIEVPSISGQPQYTVRVNEPLAARYGLSQGEVMDQLSTVFNGVSATRIQQDGKEYNVLVRLPESESNSVAALQGFLVQSSSGVHIPLTTIASIEETKGPVSILRENQRQMYTIRADIADSLATAQVMNQVNQLIAQIPVPNGYEITTGGIRQEFNDSLGNLLLMLGLAVFLVYTVMAVQFESFTYPFIVMFSVPTSVIGVIVGLLSTNLPLSFPAFIGMIIMAGIVVNNAIILVDYMNQLKRKGMEKYEAVIQAGRGRLRPILMTTITTILGMLPLSLGLGEGSETQQPIGIVTIFGLSFSMFFTLFFVPVMFTIVEDAGTLLQRLFRKKESVIVQGSDMSGNK